MAPPFGAPPFRGPTLRGTTVSGIPPLRGPTFFWFGPNPSPPLPSGRWKWPRVSTNAMVRDLDLSQAGVDGRRLEVVAEGLSLFGGAQLAMRCDIGQRFAVRWDCQGWRRHTRSTQSRKKADVPRTGRRGEGGRARLVVLASEVGGRWSSETASFLSSFGSAQSAGSAAIVEDQRGGSEGLCSITSASARTETARNRGSCLFVTFGE